MSIEREARRDAREYARAQMYYGEGAGVRRRLIENTVQSKADRNLKYHEAFMDELEKQDMAEHAEKARKERRRKDATEMVTKNTKAIATGNYQNAQSGVLVVLVAGYFLHQTGLDKKAYEKGRELYMKAKTKVQKRKVATVHNITSCK